jgi:hypothetical protein
MVGLAGILKGAGPSGMKCHRIYSLLGQFMEPERYLRMLVVMIAAGVIRHDATTEPCRMVFIELPDEPMGSQEVQ